jgi:NitT/TauT family transport system substrate-binding protein
MKKNSGFLCALFFFAHAVAGAAEFRVGQIFSASQSPTWVAREAGYFEKNGLALQVIVFKSGPVATQSMIARDIDLLTAGGVEVINANLQGAEVLFVAQNVGTFPYTLYAGKQIADGRALKGKKLAISGFGGPSEFLTRYAVEKLGLDPQKDVTLVQVGTQRFAALSSGAVDGSMIQPPDTLRAKELGFKPLFDLAASGVKFPFNPISTRKEFLAANRDVVLRFLKGYVAGLAKFHRDRVFSMHVMGKYLGVKDEAVLSETYNLWSKIFPKKPYTEKEAVVTYLKMSKKEGVNPENFFDNSVIAELDRQGYIDALYAN